MRPLLRTLLAAFLLVLPATASAQTLTVRDLVALTQAGLGDEVLIALIEADSAVFNLTPMDVLNLKKEGLSDGVLVRMIQTRRVPPPAMPARDGLSAPDAYRERETEPERGRDRAQRPPPVVVEQTVVQEVRVEAPRREPEYVYVPVVTPPRRPVKEPEPVYWGFGGKRRPDTWQEKKPEPPKRPGGGG